MAENNDLSAIMRNAAETYPYPIARACHDFLKKGPLEPWAEWELLSRDVLLPILKYLSHLLLSDLVATGRKPPHLFHRIQSILSRPLAGHYVGFLRETARYYKEENIKNGVPSLVDFVFDSEIERSITDNKDPLLGTLVDYRNLFAHGRIENEEILGQTVDRIRILTAVLLEKLFFLADYPLTSEDGLPLMGCDPVLDAKPQTLLVFSAGDVSLRPLLLKLKGQDLVLLENLDLSRRKITYRGNATYEKFTKKKLKAGDGARIFAELKALIEKVRAIDAVLPHADWGTFTERSALITDQTLSLYTEMGKFKPEWFVPRPAWQGDESVFDHFLQSDKTLLALSGGQGTGKSALVSLLADQCRKNSHAVLFINGQRFSFADVTWSGNPYPDYFAQRLHYGAPFDMGEVKRILRDAPPGKKLVLFIDAINEVDGIEIKWNRFRAMELILEWIKQIAQPSLKIVLSFRLDTYEEFEYLQDDEIPKGLADICFAGNNPRKGWVHDLEPFDKLQAKALFHKLQAHPRYGMAPAMDWGRIEEGLSGRQTDIFTNPLIFMIFLRAHHAETTVQATDTQSLFVNYSAKITGASEAAKRPWYQNALNFIKNGNITPKENLLSDLVGKMTEEGNAALLVERLQPDKKKRDKRLLLTIEDDQDRTFEDLKEGGLLVEEKIEFKKEEQHVYSRRITFVAELMLPAFDVIAQKIERNRKKSTWLKWLIACIIVLPSSWLLGLMIAYSGFRDIPAHYAKAQIIAVQSMNSFALQLWPRLTLFASSLFMGSTLILVAQGFFKKDASTPKSSEIGILQSAVISKTSREEVNVMMKLFRCLVIGWFVYTGLLIATVGPSGYNLGSNEFVTDYSRLFNQVFVPVLYMWTTGLFLLFGIYFLAPGKAPYYLLRLSRFRISSRLLRISYQRMLAHILLKEYDSLRFRNLFISIASLILFVVFILSMTRIDFTDLIKTATNSGMLITQKGYRFTLLPTTYSDLIIIVAPIWTLLYLLSFFISKWHHKLSCKRIIENPNIKPIKSGYVKFCAITWSVIGILFPVIIVGYMVFAEESIDKISAPFRKDWASAKIAYNKLMKAKGTEPRLSWNMAAMAGAGLDLSEKNLDSNDIKLLKECAFLVSPLILPRNFPETLNFKNFDRARYLAAPAKSITNLSKAKELQELVIYDPKDFFERTSGNNRLEVLEVYGEFTTLGNLYDKFKSLGALRFSESVATNGMNISTQYKNLVIEITDNSPVLEWLTPPVAENILALRSISSETRNLHLIKRLFLDIDGLQDPEILAEMDALIWLKLFVGNDKPPKEFFVKLLAVIDKHMPRLQTLEISHRFYDKDIVSPFSGFDKDEIRTLLQGYINNEGRWPKKEDGRYQIGKLWGAEKRKSGNVDPLESQVGDLNAPAPLPKPQEDSPQSITDYY